MITVQNEKNQKQYEVLFQAATNDLVKASMQEDSTIQFTATFVEVNIDADDYVNNPGQYFVNVGDNENPNFQFATGEFSTDTTYYKAEGIRTLEDFFSKLKELYTLNPKYIMLPLDEQPFEIDANKRTITVPNAFKNGVSVEGDIVAETLLFRIDRFFDAVDFNDCDMYVQWERAKDPTQYVTPLKGTAADLIDIESEPGKIIFGWPLSQKIAKVPGQIKFSIRFMKKNGNQIVYSFSTIPTTITINPGLNYDIENCERDSANELFDAVIENSETSTGPSAVRPVFDKNLDAGMYYLNDDGYSTLAVHARAADGGDIFYEWYNAANENSLGSKVLDDHPEKDKDSNYVVNGTTSESIVGYYWAKAINKLGNRQKTVQSNTIQFPGANEPAFVTPLEDTILEDGVATLTIELQPDIHGEHNTSAYQWFKKDSSAALEFAAINDETNSSIVINTPGIYKVRATNTVNRNSKSVDSESCVVYDVPGAVTIEDLAELEMVKGQTYTLTTVLPGNEFARGTVKYSWWIDYNDPHGILVDGVPSESDKQVEYARDLDRAEITITADLISMAEGGKLHCVAANTTTVGDKEVTTYSESIGYTLTR